MIEAKVALVLLLISQCLDLLITQASAHNSCAGFVGLPKTLRSTRSLPIKRMTFNKKCIETSLNGVEEKDEGSRPTREKRIVFIRHGCTYMNEYLATPGCRWGDPNFSDVFPESDGILHKYKDSPLSSKGIKQAQGLSDKLERLINGLPDAHEELSLSIDDKDVVRELDMVVVSPLTRAIKTLEIALLPHIQSEAKDGCRPKVPVVAHPYAAERVYLISDIGKVPSQLEEEFGHFVDFEAGFQHIDGKDGEWWFSLDEPSSFGSSSSKRQSFLEGEDYVEWRPNGQGQTYACPGEPDAHFEKRMVNLYRWLEERPEDTIALVCHWGVIDWMLAEEFDNCEMRVVPFDNIRPKNMPFVTEDRGNVVSNIRKN